MRFRMRRRTLSLVLAAFSQLIPQVLLQLFQRGIGVEVVGFGVDFHTGESPGRFGVCFKKTGVDVVKIHIQGAVYFVKTGKTCHNLLNRV